MLGILWEYLWPPSQGDLRGVRRAQTPRVVSLLFMACCALSACGGLITTHITSQLTRSRSGGGLHWDTARGRGEGWTWEGKWDRSKHKFHVFVVLLTLIQGTESLLFSLQLSRSGERERSIFSCSPGFQASRSPKFKEEGVGGEFGCLGPKAVSQPLLSLALGTT